MRRVSGAFNGLRPILDISDYPRPVQPGPDTLVVSTGVDVLACVGEGDAGYSIW